MNRIVSVKGWTGLAALSLAVACSSGGGGGDCTTCPQPTDAALRIHVEFDALSRGVQPSGFRLQDVSRIEIDVQGGTQGNKTLHVTPPQDAVFTGVFAGSYTVSATGFGASDLVLFRSAPQSVSLAKGDTTTVRLPMLAELGNVTLTVGGAAQGVVQARAGEDVPFVVIVRNTQGRPVPSSAVTVTSSNGFGAILFEGTNATDADGRVTGVMRASHRGVISGLAVHVDGRPVPVPADLRVDFATVVAPEASDITEISKVLIMADGADGAEFTVLVRNAAGDPLEGIPMQVTSNRNAGLDPRVDVITPAGGYETGRTDAFGRFRFTVRSNTSSFMELDEQGRLYSRSNAGQRPFVPSLIRVIADGLQVDQREISFNSTVATLGGSMMIAPQFVTITNGVGVANVVVTVPRLGGGGAAGVFVEFTNTFNESVNYVHDFRPDPGFSGFRTNAQGVWRGQLRSTQPLELFVELKADGRAIPLGPRSVFFR